MTDDRTIEQRLSDLEAHEEEFWTVLEATDRKIRAINDQNKAIAEAIQVLGSYVNVTIETLQEHTNTPATDMADRRIDVDVATALATVREILPIVTDGPTNAALVAVLDAIAAGTADDDSLDRLYDAAVASNRRDAYQEFSSTARAARASASHHAAYAAQLAIEARLGHCTQAELDEMPLWIERARKESADADTLDADDAKRARETAAWLDAGYTD